MSQLESSEMLAASSSAAHLPTESSVREEEDGQREPLISSSAVKKIF